jgi:hypothetical protein
MWLVYDEEPVAVVPLWQLAHVLGKNLAWNFAPSQLVKLVVLVLVWHTEQSPNPVIGMCNA